MHQPGYTIASSYAIISTGHPKLIATVFVLTPAYAPYEANPAFTRLLRFDFLVGLHGVLIVGRHRVNFIGGKLDAERQLVSVKRRWT
jgi:hypothetical protein